MRGPARTRGANINKTRLSRLLRKNARPAERKLWRHLQARSLGGFKFVRQEPIGPYVVDFVCREKRLVIEIDGSQHAESKADAARDQWLVAHRYRVLRVWNNDVMRNIAGVWKTTAVSAEAPPHPDPLPASGEREP